VPPTKHQWGVKNDIEVAVAKKMHKDRVSLRQIGKKLKRTHQWVDNVLRPEKRVNYTQKYIQRYEKEMNDLVKKNLLDLPDYFDGSTDELFSSVAFCMFNSIHPAIYAIRINIQERNPESLKLLGVKMLTNDEICIFVKNNPEYKNLCLNIGYTCRTDPRYDSSNLNNTNIEPFGAFVRGTAFVKENGDQFKAKEVRDDLKTEAIGVANFDNMTTARGFEAFLQYLVLNGCGIIKPNPKENNVVTITSGLRRFDNGTKGTDTRDGKLHSVFICYATNIIGNKNCQAKATTHIRMESIELNISVTTNKQKENGKQYLGIGAAAVQHDYPISQDSP